MNTLLQDFVVIKMDVEGAEYELIPHMVDMSIWTVVHYFFIEWHPPGVHNALVIQAKAAEEKLKADGVNIPSNDSAA